MNPRRVAAVLALVCSVAACSSDPKVVGSTGAVAVSSASDTSSVASTTTSTMSATTMPVVTAPVVVATVTTPVSTSVAGAAVDPRLSPEPLGIDGECSEAGCISVRVTLAGEVVTYDSGNSTLTFTQSGSTLVVDSPFGDAAYLAMMGPDDVAYIAGTPPTATDPLLELIAVPTSGAAAGKEIARVGDLDGTGDSSLIATATGVMQVGCCGFDERLPSAGTPVAMPWVAPTGEPSGIVVPEVHLEYPGDDTTIVVRTAVDGAEQRWTVPTVLAGRDMPPAVATSDSGVLLWMYDPYLTPDGPAVLYDFRPDGSVDTFRMGPYLYAAALHSSRFVITFDDGYVKLTLP